MGLKDLTTLIPVHVVSLVIKFHQSVNDGVVELSFQFSFLRHFFNPQCTRYGSVSSVAPPRFVFQIYSFKSWCTPSPAFVFQHIFLPRKDVITLKKWFIWSWVYSQQMEDVGVRTESPQSTLDRKIFRLQNFCSVTTAEAVKREQPSSLMDKAGIVKGQIVSQTTRQQLIWLKQ